MSRSSQLIELFSRHLEEPPRGYETYEAWITQEESAYPEIREEIRIAAIELLRSPVGLVRSSALQALACTGGMEDVSFLESFAKKNDDAVLAGIPFAISHITLRHSSIEALLERVDDHASFEMFARALAKERSVAQRIEQAHPDRYRLDGAMGWKSADISSFIYAGLSAFDSDPEGAPPSWHGFAEFLYFGKVIE